MRDRCENAFRVLLTLLGTTEEAFRSKNITMANTIEELIWEMKQKGYKYAEIEDVIRGKYPDEKRSLRNLIYRVIKKRTKRG